MYYPCSGGRVHGKGAYQFCLRPGTSQADGVGLVGGASRALGFRRAFISHIILPITAMCPSNIPGHPCIRRTLPLAKAPMSADSPRRGELPSSCSRVHGDGLADNEAIANEFADRLAGIGVGDFVNFVGVEPDLALATADHGGSEALLRPEVDPVVSRWLVRGSGRRGEIHELKSFPFH
jgi:hypothetical protein